MESTKLYWWAAPYKLISFFVLPIYTLIYLLRRNSFQNYLNFNYFLLGALFLLVFTYSMWFGKRVYLKKSLPKFQVKLIYLDILAWLTFIAYFIWFHTVFFDMSLFFNILTGKMGTDGVRSIISTIPGITTLSQLGTVYVIFYLSQFDEIKEKRKKKYKVYFVLIMLLTLFRVIAWSERLAIIEMVIPMFVILLSNQKKRFNRTLKFAPYIGIVGMLVFFGITEYFRSWLSYYQYVYPGSYVNFVLDRVSNYYYTALNNGAGMMQFLGYPSHEFIYVLDWFYKLPFIGNYIYNAYSISDNYLNFLIQYADPEFNNNSGIFTIYFDLGIPLTLIFIFFVGLFIGYMYREFATKQGIGMILYPAMFISVLEVMRIPYLTTSRFFPIALFIFIGYLFFHKKPIQIKSETVQSLDTINEAS